MEITIELVKAVEDIGRYSRSAISAEAAEQIAQAFGQSLESLGIEGIFREAGDIDFAQRLETHTTGVSVAVHVLAYKLQKALVPDFEYPECPFMGAGKSADWYTGTALGAITDAIGYPDMYVTAVYGPYTIHTAEDGHKFHYLNEERPVLGYELRRRGDTWETIQTFNEEEAAYDALIFLANEGR